MAQIELFRDQMNNGANWGTNASGTDYAATFNYDYSADGIPEAPNTRGGDDATRGVKLEANITSATVDYFTIYPLGQSFSNSWQLRFDAWMNYGTTGTTEFMGGGLGYNDTDADLTSGAQFIATGDGGSAADYRSITNGGYMSTGSYYPAGSLNASADYYVTNLPSVNGSTAGTPAFQWVTWEFNVQGDIVSVYMEKTNAERFLLISYDVQPGVAPTTDGNISLYYADFFTSVAGPAGSTFGLIDNVVVTDLTPTNPSVSVTATTDTTSMDTSSPPGVFTLTRTGDTGSALPVSYSLSGTATNGVQYQSLSGTANFGVGASSTTVNVVPIPYSPAGPTRSVILTVDPGAGYDPFPPTSATVWIVDTNTPAISVARKDAQLYERTNDYARFTLTRLGDTNAYLAQVNVSYGGTAVQGTQIYVDSTNTAVTFNAGQLTADVYVYALHDGVVTGPLTVTATVEPMTPGFGDYDVGTPATSVDAATRVDSDDPPETILWQDNLHTDTSANWTQLFATANAAPYDATVTWAFDYSGAPYYAVPAPHSGGDTHGLFMQVNKNDATAAAAALNLYPNGQNFSGNYAVRFDMFLIQGTTATTEYALFGINHSGTKTNWFRNSTGGVDPTTWDFDGVFYDVEADGAALGDYVGYSSPTVSPPNPTPITSGRNASTLTGVFKTPPWTPGAGDGGAAANLGGSGTPMWADVELRQVNGMIYWYINHTLIFAYTNTTGYDSGNIMLGYTDAYDSIGSADAGVVYANARVISLASPVITDIAVVGGNVEVTFTANSSDVPGQFTLQESSPSVTGAYADTSSTISSLGGGAFKAVKAVPSAQTFYRVRRIY